VAQPRRLMLTRSEFNEVQQIIMSAWHTGDLDGAFAAIEAVLKDGTGEMKGQCLFYRGMIRQAEGALENAKEDWLQAHHYSAGGTFLRYELERSLGEVCEETHAPQEAQGWYLAALQSCSTGDEFSGNRTLSAYLRLCGGIVSPEDHALVASVVEKSLRVLQLPGVPDVADLDGSVASLTSRFNEMIAEASAYR